MTRNVITTLAMAALFVGAAWNVALSASVTYEHDARGRLTKATFDNGTVVTYRYDANGNRTAAEVAPGADTEPPSTPTQLRATVVSQSQVNLSWSASADDVGVAGYRLERCAGTGCSNFLQVAAPTTNSHSDTSLTSNATYAYRVRAIDAVGNLSGYSQSVAVTMPDTTAPTAPGTPSFSGLTMASVTVSWTAATDDGGVVGYRYRLNAGAWQSVGVALSVNLTDLQAATTYLFEVQARDSANNWGPVASNSFTTPDTQAPSAPGVPSFSGISMTAATVNWSVASDNVGVVGYDYRLGAGDWQSLGQVLSVSLTGLSAATSYTFSVRARDGAGNLGPSSSAAFKTIDTAAPSAPTALSASAPSSSRVNLSWAASTDNVGVVGYRIRRGGVQIGTSATTGYADTTVVGSTSYSYTISAYDAAGNSSSLSSAVTVTTPDTIAPVVPTGLTATAVSATQVRLQWNAASDSGGSGLAGYRIHRNGVQIATSTSTTYTDSSVSPSTAYSYAVQAYDRANNLSAISGAVSVTTPSNVPSTPNLNLTMESITFFTVHWSVPTGPLSYYELELTVNWWTTSIRTFLPPKTSEQYGGSDTEWSFRIRACNASHQCSAWSLAQSTHTCPFGGCP